jgi:hypothetical protein
MSYFLQPALLCTVNNYLHSRYASHMSPGVIKVVSIASESSNIFVIKPQLKIAPQCVSVALSLINYAQNNLNICSAPSASTSTALLISLLQFLRTEQTINDKKCSNYGYCLVRLGTFHRFFLVWGGRSYNGHGAKCSANLIQEDTP